MTAKSIKDCFQCRSAFHGGTVLAGRFGQICDNKKKKNHHLLKLYVIYSNYRKSRRASAW